VTAGHPVEAIREYVVEAGVDLVVMGTHGRSGVDRLILGGVAEGIVRTSPVPVTTVRLSDGGSR
jgi:nucleotide-binding universal stress UspA family protein